MTPLIAKFIQFTEKPDAFHWFDVGFTPEEVFLKPMDIELLMRLPFDRMSIVGIDADKNEFQILVSAVNGRVVLAAVAVSKGALHISAAPFSYEPHADGLLLSKPQGQEFNAEASHSVMTLLHVILEKISGEGATAHKPTRVGTPAQQAKRAKHGKAPLFDWHTVKVQPAQHKADTQGGTHSSPRLHDRRGHWRKYPSGKVGWVKNCKVGDASKGVVFKDYEVKA